MHPLFKDEAQMMSKVGFLVDSKILPESHAIIYRGFAIENAILYNSCEKLINNWTAYQKTLHISLYYPIISKHSISTFFVPVLDEKIILPELKKRGWEKAFIREDEKSLYWLDEEASVWPIMSMSDMTKAYRKVGLHGPFAIREYINNPKIFYDEQRYWILRGKAYHPTGVIPNFVCSMAEKMFLFSGSNYFTMDVADKFIVEINPGESSDRGGDNPLDYFCKIFVETFLKE